MDELIRRECSAFLLNLLSVHPNAELLETLRDHIRGTAAWNEFILHANRNRVSGLALHNLDRLGREDLIPEAARAALHERASMFTDKHSTTLRDLAAIHAAFTEAQLPYLLFKGAALVETLYADPSQRPFADYDLLVERNRIDQAADLLQQMGYASTDPLPRKYYLRFHLHLTFSRRTPRANIDLHWCLVGPYDLATIEYGDLIRRAKAPSRGSIVNPVLSPVDQILVNAIHLHKHLGYLLPLLTHSDLPRHVIAGKYLILACDFVRLIHHHAAVHPVEELEDQMNKWNVADRVQFCARLCRALWGEDEHLTPLLGGRRVRRYASGHVLARFLASWTMLGHKPMRLSGVTPTRLLTLPAAFFPGKESLGRYYDADTSGAIVFWWIVHPLRMGILMAWNFVCCVTGWARILLRTGFARIHGLA